MTNPQKDDSKLGDLTSRLRSLAEGRETLDVAQFQFVDLDEIRTAYGERWPENKERILSTAENFLRRRVDPSDLLIAAAGGFLVVFGSANGAAADASAGSLSHGLNEFFLGELGEVPAPRMQATNHSVPVAKLAETLAAVDFVDPPPPPAVATDAAGLPNVDWRYQPVWDVRREALTSWYVSPYCRKTSERLPGYQFESAQIPAAQSAAIDEASLWVSEQALAELIPSGKQLLIGASIHVSTLMNLATRARLLSAINRLEPGYFRYRILKIAGVAPGFPRLYLNEIVSMLRTKVQNVVVGGAWNEPDIAGLVNSGPVAVGVTLTKSVLGPSAPVQPAALLHKLTTDAQLAHSARMRFFVEGRIERDLAAKLAASSVDNIVSPRIWPAAGIPDSMLKWPSARLAG